MHRLARLCPLPPLVVVAACVTSPTWGDEPTRRDPIDWTGTASAARAPLRIQAFNHATGAFETVRSFEASSSRVASSPDLFSWSTVGLTLPDRYWVPAGASCRDGGMANLRVQERNTDGSFRDLVTFDAAGEACLYEQIGDGTHPVAAGNACKREDDTIALFAPPQCVPATTFDATPALVTIRVSDGLRVWQTTSEPGATDITASGVSRTRPLTATAMVRDRDGAVSRVNLVGETVVRCRFADGSFTALPLGVSATNDQAAREGELADIGLDAARTIDVNRLTSATCPAGSTFQRLDVTLFATGANTTGLTRTSRQVRFSL